MAAQQPAPHSHLSAQHSLGKSPKKNSLLARLWPLGGLLALIWFLIRVIPKPSRATYPCQRAAFPLASGFVVWLLGISTSLFLARHSHRTLRQGRPIAGLMGFSLAALMLVLSADNPIPPAIGDQALPFVPTEAPNQPIGSPRGIMPGRVVWMYQPEATRWDGDQEWWWSAENTDQGLVADMLAQGLQTLTGTQDLREAWQALFQDFNARRGKGRTDYKAGEQIAIKLNLNQIGSYRHPGNALFPAPQIVLGLLRQLVHQAGIPPEEIALYDASRYFPDALAAPIQDEFPGIRCIDWQGGRGREAFQRDEATRVYWSQALTLERGGGNPTYLPTCVSQAGYLINLTNLKGHSLAGITLGAKNHFGSISADRHGSPTSSPPRGAGLHPYVAVHDFALGNPDWESFERPMGSYNPLVDLMGHQHLGEKTLLFVIDGLYATPEQNGSLKDSHRWQSAPFNGDWPSSIFLSQDGVAIESVGLDFLRSEPTQTQVYGNVDNYLHEAAQAHNPPSGVFYDPEADGSPLANLGVHEHWNNPLDKQYSGNLGLSGGIELVSPHVVTAVEADAATLPQDYALGNYPNPFNATTFVSFTLPNSSNIRLTIYNTLGQQIAQLFDGPRLPGHSTVLWDGRDDSGKAVKSGIYFARLTTDTIQRHHKLLLLR